MEELSLIFKENNIDYKNIKFIVFTIPKTGRFSIFRTLKTHFCLENIISFHSIIELKEIDIRFEKHTIFQIISFIEKNSIHEKIYIFSSYRIPSERFISFYYHNNNVFQLDRSLIENINIDFLLNSVKKTGNELTDFKEVFINLYEREFNIDFTKLKYNNEKGYCKIDYTNKINWIFTSIYDIQKCFSNLKDIDSIFENIPVIFDNVNINQQYLNIKNKIHFDEKCKEYFYLKEKKIMDFYNYVLK